VHNKELHNLYSSSSIIRMNKSWRMRWAPQGITNGGEAECIQYNSVGARSKRSKRLDNIKMSLTRGSIVGGGTLNRMS
jgi:hypothetical protein